MSLTTMRAGGAHTLPLVLLHAFPLDPRMWREAAGLVPEGRRVLAVDLLGSRLRSDDLPAPNLETAADDVAAALAAAGIARAVVAGLSMGGYVALALLARHPDLVAGLAIVDSTAAADPPHVAENRRARAARLTSSGTLDEVLPDVDVLVGASTRRTRPQVRDDVLGWVREQVPAGLAWQQRAMAVRPDRTAVLAAFTGPVTVVVGDEDVPTPVEVARRTAGAARDAVLVVLPGVGHLSAVEDPAAVAAALGDLSTRADAAR